MGPKNLKPVDPESQTHEKVQDYFGSQTHNPSITDMIEMSFYMRHE